MLNWMLSAISMCEYELDSMQVHYAAILQPSLNCHSCNYEINTHEQDTMKSYLEFVASDR